MARRSFIGYSVLVVVVVAGVIAGIKVLVPRAPLSQTHVIVTVTPQGDGSCTLTFNPDTSPDPVERPTYPYWVVVHSSTQDSVTWQVPDGTPGVFTANFDPNNSPWQRGASSFSFSAQHPKDSGPTMDPGWLCDLGLRKCPYPYTIDRCNGYTGSRGTGPGDPGLGVHATK